MSKSLSEKSMERHFPNLEKKFAKISKYDAFILLTQKLLDKRSNIGKKKYSFFNKFIKDFINEKVVPYIINYKKLLKETSTIDEWKNHLPDFRKKLNEIITNIITDIQKSGYIITINKKTIKLNLNQLYNLFYNYMNIFNYNRLDEILFLSPSKNPNKQTKIRWLNADATLNNLWINLYYSYHYDNDIKYVDENDFPYIIIKSFISIIIKDIKDITSCKDPTCVYNKDKNKCVKPNSYVQFIANCKSLNKSFDKCKELYNKNLNEIKNKACDYYRDNKIISKQKSCPKKRLPIDDNCNDENYKILKTNKYGVKCCYKEKTKPKVKTPIPISSSKPSNPFINISIPKKIYLNKDKLKLAKIKHNYQYKNKPIKVNN